jgi:tetratricopeptide (TPR) repeat protein
VLEIAAHELAAVRDQFGQAIAHTYQGLILESEQETNQAIGEFEKASQMLSEMGMLGFRIDAVAGLARIALSQGRLDEAQRYGLETWEYLMKADITGMELPQLAYLTCFKVFHRLGDLEKAHAILEQSLKHLNQEAERIENPDWKRIFLENIPEHHALLQVSHLFPTSSGPPKQP